MIYPFICDNCRTSKEIHCSIHEWKVGDYPSCCGGKMRRLYRFQIATSLEKDKPENQMARIMTGGSNSREDWLKWQRRDAKDEEKFMAKMKPQEPVDTSFADIDVAGAWTAAHAGTDQLMRWRADNIPTDPLAAEAA